MVRLSWLGSRRTRLYLMAFLFLIGPMVAFSQQGSWFPNTTIPGANGSEVSGFNGAGPSTVVNTFYTATQSWLSAMSTTATRLFWALAFIDFVWTVITLGLQSQELMPFFAGLIRKIATIGFFGALLANGQGLSASIVTFFMYLGSQAGGVDASALSASGIMGAGVQLAGHMLKSAAGTAATASPIGLMLGSSSIGTAIILAIGAFLMVAVYVVIALHFVIAMVEAYITIGAGYIFLGFGGSRWTVPYTEKYIGMIVAAGVRIMVLELMIGLGGALYNSWDAMAQQIGNIPDIFSGGSVAGQWTGVQLLFALVSSIGIYGLLCWQIPQIAANVVGGSLSMSGGDVLGAAAAGGTAGMAAANFGGSRSGDSEAAKSAVSSVQQAAMTGASMGVQAGMAMATGGASAAASGAAFVGGAGGAGAAGAGGVVSGVGGVGGGMAAGMDGKTPPVPGGGSSGSGGGMMPNDAGKQAFEAAGGKGEYKYGAGGEQSDSDGNASAQRVGDRAADMARQDLLGGGVYGNGNGNGNRSVPPPPQGGTVSGQRENDGDSSGDLVGALHGLAKEGQSALRQMPGGSARVGGTNPNVGHGE